MASDPTCNNEAELSDSEYEYEYDKTVTETFFVDVHMSSVKDARKGQNNGQSSQRAIPNPFMSYGAQKNEGDANKDNSTGTARKDASSAQAVEDSNRSQELQIMDLRSTNPIVSYNNRVYNCTWYDTIGTSMFFSAHGNDIDLEPAASDGDVDLIETSRIKLVAREAQLLPKPDPAKSPTKGSKGIAKTAKGSGLGALSTSNPKINADIKKQARFLERLMEVKSSKGEVDNVRTVRKRGAQTVAGETDNANKRRQHMPPTSRPELEKEIWNLNRLTLQGDPDALERLEEIYGLFGDNEPDVAAAAAQPSGAGEEQSEDQAEVTSPKRP
ncbi:MAG: hypothetical protein Q9160_002764 [Pyrenula sp. 1 TL-2023]